MSATEFEVKIRTEFSKTFVQHGTLETGPIPEGRGTPTNTTSNTQAVGRPGVWGVDDSYQFGLPVGASVRSLKREAYTKEISSVSAGGGLSDSSLWVSETVSGPGRQGEKERTRVGDQFEDEGHLKGSRRETVTIGETQDTHL